jgi:hypothetical protein
MDVVSNEVIGYWGALVATLNQRGLLKDRPQRGGKIVPEADALLLPDRVIFALDLQRLGGIARERWLDTDLWEQWRAALRGRRCFVSDGGGLAICVAREPGEHVKRLPRVIPLDLSDLPEKPYTVTLGVSRRGPVTLDLAGKNRAILIGGTSGSGKTNLMQSAILQLAAKHDPSEIQFAVVDTKEVDFGPTFDRLPHLFAPIAHTLEDAAQLIEAVESERLRRQAVMAQAGVNDWRRAEELGLLMLVVDEAADFAKTPTMDTLVEVARKGRAMGISLVLATQSPSAKVISPQVRANLPTAIAFQTRTDIESRVILGKRGAEDMNRPGLALTFIGGHWQEVQTLRVELTDVADVAPPPRPALKEIERRLVRYALDHLDGCFVIGTLYDAFKGEVSKRALTALAQRWEARGWLTTPAHATDPRRVTDDLRALCPALARGSGDRVTGVIGGDRGSQVVTGTVTGWRYHDFRVNGWRVA